METEMGWVRFEVNLGNDEERFLATKAIPLTGLDGKRLSAEEVGTLAHAAYVEVCEHAEKLIRSFGFVGIAQHAEQSLAEKAAAPRKRAARKPAAKKPTRRRTR